MPTKRITINIPDEDKLWLDGYAKVHKISVAEAVWKGIGVLKQEQRQTTYRKMLAVTFGTWKKGDGLAYQGEMRAEWE